MPGAIVLEGNVKWIIPLLIIVATAALTLYTVVPTIEFFTETSKKNSQEEEKEKEEPKEDTETSKKNSQEESTNDKNEIDDLEKMVAILKKKLAIATNQEGKTTKPVAPVNPSLKENFVTYTNSAEILQPNWRKKDLPKTLEKYNGQIQGYNCGEYSDFTITQPTSCVGKKCNNKYMKPPTGQSDYIFPGRKVNKTNCIRHASKPHILGYEQDVNKKILEYESMNVLPDYKPSNVASLERPQYTYHRKDGIDDPIITDENRFELGTLNAFKRKTKDYSVE